MFFIRQQIIFAAGFQMFSLFASLLSCGGNFLVRFLSHALDIVAHALGIRACVERGRICSFYVCHQSLGFHRAGTHCDNAMN